MRRDHRVTWRKKSRTILKEEEESRMRIGLLGTGISPFLRRHHPSKQRTVGWLEREASAEEEIEQRRLLVGWLSREEKEVGGGWQWLSGAVASAIFAPTLTRRVGLGRNEKLRLTEGKDGDF
jgi:hypothetical protein